MPTLPLKCHCRQPTPCSYFIAFFRIVPSVGGFCARSTWSRRSCRYLCPLPSAVQQTFASVHSTCDSVLSFRPEKDLLEWGRVGQIRFHGAYRGNAFNRISSKGRLDPTGPHGCASGNCLLTGRGSDAFRFPAQRNGHRCFRGSGHTCRGDRFTSRGRWLLNIAAIRAGQSHSSGCIEPPHFDQKEVMRVFRLHGSAHLQFSWRTRRFSLRCTSSQRPNQVCQNFKMISMSSAAASSSVWLTPVILRLLIALLYCRLHEFTFCCLYLRVVFRSPSQQRTLSPL